MLLGAPTGSGKTIASEIAIFRVSNTYPNGKVVQIAPLKALVRERIEDWKHRLEVRLGQKLVEFTGDVTPDARVIRDSYVIITTLEKWDGISRPWETREYVKDVALIVIDEIHSLGEDRGPAHGNCFFIVIFYNRRKQKQKYVEIRNLFFFGVYQLFFRFNSQHIFLSFFRFRFRLFFRLLLFFYLGSHTNFSEQHWPMHAIWPIGYRIKDMDSFDFKPSVRPVPLSVHISGYPGKNYCPRMATMNRPTYQAIRQYPPCTPALIFVSSRRQPRLTALDLIAFLAGEDNPKQFMHLPEHFIMDQILENIKDSN